MLSSMKQISVPEMLKSNIETWWRLEVDDNSVDNVELEDFRLEERCHYPERVPVRFGYVDTDIVEV